MQKKHTSQNHRYHSTQKKQHMKHVCSMQTTAEWEKIYEYIFKKKLSKR